MSATNLDVGVVRETAATEKRNCQRNEPRANPAIFFCHIRISFRKSVYSPRRR